MQIYAVDALLIASRTATSDRKM